MSGKLVRLTTLIGVILTVVTTAAFAQSAVNAVWPGYHGFSQRAGQNVDATHSINAGDHTLIWTYPRTPTVAASDSVLNQSAAAFTNPTTWISSIDSTNYGTQPTGPNDFSYIKADTAGSDTVTWSFPIGAPQNAPAGKYRVYVRHLSAASAGLTATTGAVYTVTDRNRSYTYTIDQTQNIGAWVQLGNLFEFSAATQSVSLSSKTADLVSSNVVVMANAVRFVRDTSNPEVIVDDDPANGFTASGAWTAGASIGTTGLVAGSSYNGGFHYATATTVEASAITATWAIPDFTPTGKYQVYAWFPSTYDYPDPVGVVNTTAARYTIAGNRYTIDQSDSSSGGVWKLITTQVVTLSSSNVIQLSNYDPNAANNTIVVADAIKLVSATGAEIYASPVAGEVLADWDFGADGAYNAYIPVVYTNTVEPPLISGEDPQNVGSIVCANGVTPALPMTAALVDRLKISLGTALWEYPSGNPSLRDPLEGPVQNGFYSTPTLTYYMDTSVNPIVRKTALIATGMDGQIYCMDAEGVASSNKSVTQRKSKLLWKGPGITESEPYYTTAGSYQIPNPWQSVAGRTDAYGGQFLYAICTAAGSPATPVTWTFSDAKRTAIGEPNASGEGWAYNVSVWIPALGAGAAGLLPATDAVYNVTYETGDAAPAVQSVTVNLAETKNQGRWVSLGKFFNVSKVELQTTTKQTTPANYAVVADACMIVPEQVGAFGYSSPVTDISKYENLSGSEDGNLVFAVTADGRVMSLNILPINYTAGSDTLHFGKVNWFYPAIREKLVVSGSGDETQPGLGPVIASATYSRGSVIGAPGKLLLATTDQFGGSGDVFCLTGIDFGTIGNPVLDWQFPSSTVTTDSDRQLSFSSSPAVSGNTVYIGSEYGSVFALNLNKAASGSQAVWKYPASASDVPLGAFRYSTPAFATIDTVDRVWISSADGIIYSFNAGNVADNARRMTTDTTVSAQYYADPSLRSAVYGSVGIDGRNGTTKPEFMYVGTMADQGILRWYLARSGLVGSSLNWKSFGWPALGPIFGSPAPVQTMNRRNGDITIASGTSAVDYVYFTAEDGRVYALSPKYNASGGSDGTAWGGEWAGGGWLYDTEPGTNPLVEEQPTAAGGDIQFETVDPTFYKNTYDADPEPRDTVVTADLTVPATWDTPSWLVRKDMKLVDSTAVLPTGADAARNQALVDLLADRAKAVRNVPDALFDSRAKRLPPYGPLYVEWGESIYLALWNINPDELKSGQSSITIQLHNASAGSGAGMELTAKVKAYREYTVVDESQISGAGYKPFTYFGTTKNVRRAYMLAQVDLKSTGSKPPTPGPGWEIYAKVTKTSGDQTIDLAKLEIKSGIPVPKMNQQVDTTNPPITGVNAPAVQYTYDKLEIGINNPLAIRDDGSGRDAGGDPNKTATKVLAWGIDRYDPLAHFNGNSAVDATGYSDGRSTKYMPILWVRNATHGATTVPRNLGIADRSAGGASTSPVQISNFRIGTWDLNWQGGEGAIPSKAYNSVKAPAFGMKFGWEYGIGSVDYPDVLMRYEKFRTTMDGKDPVRAATLIPCVTASTVKPSDYSSATLRPDQVEVSVDVPRFQPANTTNDDLSLQPRGYSRVMTAYVDSNRNGGFDDGTVRLGKPTTYQEAYRNFRYDLTVAPDPKIEVKETLVDVGLAPHGLGENMGWGFSPYTADPMWTDGVSKWFKTLTVRNLGNVNLCRLRVDKDIMLLGDGARYPILGENITSSLDEFMLGVNVQQPALSTGALGYTLTKARVGDPDPTTLTIPDRRKWNVMSAADKNAAENALRGEELPLLPMISVRVPVSQPVGTYVAKGVRVYSDMNNNNSWYAGEKDWNGNGTLDPSEDWNGNNILDAAEPSTDPSIDLKIAVRETQLTGGIIPTSLTQIDDASSSRVADGGPAAFRDPGTGKVNLFFVSNRRSDPPTDSTLHPNWDTPNDSRIVEFSRAPFFINQAVLDKDADDVNNPWRVFWKPSALGTGSRWWNAPYSAIPSFQWDTRKLDQVYGTGAAVPVWRFDNKDTSSLQVRHTSPYVAVNEDNGKGYMVWAGAAAITKPAPDRYRANEERIFFANVTGGTVDNTLEADPPTAAGIHTISSKPNVAKREPSVAAWGANPESIAVLWQGMMGNRWGIYFNASSDGINWTNDAQVRTSDGLAMVGSPNIVRHSVSQINEVPARFNTDLIDMVYTGTGKITRNSDILLSRYAPVIDTRSILSPTKRALPLPRVYDEKLSYVAKYGFYTSEHTAWIRLDNRFDTPIIDRWGDPGIDLPFIHIVLGDGYTQPAGTVLSVTDGSVDGSGGTPIRPKVDSVTGIYTYEYPQGTPAYDILGKTFVDYAEGVIKFTRPLKNAGSGSGSSKPEVYADYTPQTWRLTTDLATDTSPRAFIERTPMTPGANPGLGNSVSAPVDRLWVMWRKASAGAKGNVIYYKTYRMGIDLKNIGAVPIRINTGEDDPYGNVLYGGTYPFTNDPADKNLNTVRDRPGSTWAPVTIGGVTGPFEVDATGTKIYLNQVDERYPAMDRLVTKVRNVNDPARDSLGMSPGPVTINYVDINGNAQSVSSDSVFWIPEIGEQSLTGSTSTANVNEGSIWAFADPNPPKFKLPDETGLSPLSKIWLFWTSTRQDNTDLFWETVFPGLTVK